MQVLINTEYSGLDFNIPALHRYNELAGTQMVHFSYVEDIGNHIKYYEFCEEYSPDFIPIVLLSPDDPELDNLASVYFDNIQRNDKHLIQVFEEFGDKISDEHLYNRLAIIEIPDNANWHIIGQDWGGETLVVKTLKIDLEKIDNYGKMSINEFTNYLENNPDVVEFCEAYYNK